MRNESKVFLLLTLFPFICSLAQAADSLTITTYYPSPQGVYSEAIIANRLAVGDVNGDGQYTPLDMAVDNSGNAIPGSLTVAGKVGIGTITPNANLDVNGSVKISDDPVCDANKIGAIRYHDDKLQFCDGADFKDVGAVAKYAIIADEKIAGTHGGASTTTWSTRDLNTEISDPENIVSLSSNQFILQPGDYLIEASAPAVVVHEHRIRLQNISDGSIVIMGTSSYSNDSYRGETRSFLAVMISINAAKSFVIQHRCSEAIADYGLGRFSNYDSAPEIYTMVKITKL
jgi:hypothetical protein